MNCLAEAIHCTSTNLINSSWPMCFFGALLTGALCAVALFAGTLAADLLHLWLLDFVLLLLLIDLLTVCRPTVFTVIRLQALGPSLLLLAGLVCGRGIFYNQAWISLQTSRRRRV